MEEPRTRYQIGCIAADIALTLVFLAVYVFFTLRPGALIDGELFSPRRQGGLHPVYRGPPRRPRHCRLHPHPGRRSVPAGFLPALFRRVPGCLRKGRLPVGGRPSSPSGEDILWEGYYSQDEFLSLRDKNGDYTDWVEIYSTPYNWNEFTPPWTTW